MAMRYGGGMAVSNRRASSGNRAIGNRECLVFTAVVNMVTTFIKTGHGLKRINLGISVL